MYPMVEKRLSLPLENDQVIYYLQPLDALLDTRQSVWRSGHQHLLRRSRQELTAIQ